MPDTGNAKDCLELPPTNFSIFTLKKVTWLVSQYWVLFSISFCLYRAYFAHLISSNLSCNLCLWYYDQLVHFDKEINANVYHRSLSGSILNVSIVHLNGIWQLIWHYLSKPVLGRHPVLSEHYSIPQGCPLNTGFTVSSKKFTFAQSKRFPPKHNPPVRGNNS